MNLSLLPSVNRTVDQFPVLTYHSLDDSGSVISISPTQFRWQMEYLRENGWRTLTLDQMMDGHARGAWPAKSFLLTFDDGFSNFAVHALPTLATCGFSAMVFVIAERAGQINDWRGQRNSVPLNRLMDWASLQTIAETGLVEIGGHSLSHSRMLPLKAEESEREIAECKIMLEDRIGRAVQAFAYPYGETTRALEMIVSRYYRAGFGTRLGFAMPTSRATAFERIDAFYLREPRFFRTFASGGLQGYLKIRRWIREVRQRFQGTGL